jgi:hypothetical protein
MAIKPARSFPSGVKTKFHPVVRPKVLYQDTRTSKFTAKQLSDANELHSGMERPARWGFIVPCATVTY